MTEREISAHIKSGELCQVGSEYSCNICSCPLGRNPLPHIQGATHRNAAFLQALSEPSKYKTLYSSLPKTIQEAHRNGLVTVSGTNVECRACQVSLTGEKPLAEHLSSSKHLNKAAAFGAPQASGVKGPKPPPTSAGAASAKMKFDYVNDSLSFGQRDPGPMNLIHPAVAEAIDKNFVKHTPGTTDFQCTACPGAGRITGVEPMRQHLEGKSHLNKVKDYQLQEVSRRAVGTPQQRPFDMGGFTQNINIMMQPNNNYGVSQPAAAHHYASDAGPAPSLFKEQGTEEGPARPSKVYKNASSPRGIVVIFNYIFKNDAKKLRKGARKDHENLKEVFTKMDYAVWPTNIDLTRQETLVKLDEIRRSSELGKVDSLITVFLSHGGASENEFKTIEGSTLSVDEIIYTYFTDKECPLMKGKPKLFIFNYCRGEAVPSDPKLEYDSWNPGTKELEPPVDVAIVQATLPHFTAGRYQETGTIFVNEFCNVVEKNSKDMELAEIIYETSIQMKKDSQGNTPTVLPIHFGKFKFM